MEIWCGDENVAKRYMEIQMRGPTTEAEMNFKASESAFDPPWFGGAPMAEMVTKDIAMIRVSGDLVPGSADWRMLYGMIGYEDIKAAVVEAVGREDVKGILLYFDTPGGAVKGVEATARLLNEVKKYKPMVGFANTAASAGYWLASTCQYLVADNTSMVGSLGSIIQLVNYTKAYEKGGVEFHTFKSGVLKMAGNPREEMTDEVKTYFMTLVEDITSIFYRNIADYRGMSYDKLRQDYGDGRGVLGMRALAGGLIDELGGTGEALAKLSEMIEANDTASNLRKM